MVSSDDFRILSLDGGGAKGVYTLGILREIELLIGHPICEEFDLIYGTSTGAIIAALLALGRSVEEAINYYYEVVPDVMGQSTSAERTAALKRHAARLLGDARFDAFKTDVGIVTTNYELARPMTFKSSVRQAYTMRASFVPGFGCTIADAVVASSAAYPFFERARVVTANQGEAELIDGGFVANNPTLLAIADAVKAYKVPRRKIKVLSLGVGVYKEPKPGILHRIIFQFEAARLIPKLLEANTTTIEQIRLILFPDITSVRINDSFLHDEHATDMFESDLGKLKKLITLSRFSFSKCEGDLRRKFGW
jgi:patatin-like phospholipase/acyl hydrolase